MKKRKLFLSFTGLLQRIHDSLISQDDLDRGLYFFLCSRNHVFYPDRGGWDNEAETIFKDTPAESELALKRIRAAFAKALEEGRAKSWSAILDSDAQLMTVGKRPPIYQLLDELLEFNGYPRLSTKVRPGFPYSRKSVVEAIPLANIPLDAVGPLNYLPFEEAVT